MVKLSRLYPDFIPINFGELLAESFRHIFHFPA